MMKIRYFDRFSFTLEDKHFNAFANMNETEEYFTKIFRFYSFYLNREKEKFNSLFNYDENSYAYETYFYGYSFDFSELIETIQEEEETIPYWEEEKKENLYLEYSEFFGKVETFFYERMLNKAGIDNKLVHQFIVEIDYLLEVIDRIFDMIDTW